MKKQITEHAAAAKLIRSELKRRGYAGRVTAKSYSGGSSVDVTINADLSPDAVADIEKFCGQFQEGHFNGMEDIYEYSNTNDDIPQVKFVFVRVEYSDEIRAKAAAMVDDCEGLPEYERSGYIYRALTGAWGDLWTAA